VEEVQRYFQENEKEAVESCMTISGFGFSGRSQTNGMLFIKLKDWHLRNRSIFISSRTGYFVAIDRI